MIVRSASHQDIDSVLPLVKAFADEGMVKYGLGYDEDSARQTMKAVLDTNGRAFVMELDGKLVGVLAGLIVPFALDYRIKIFQEFVWYVLPEHRGKGLELLVAVECICRHEGVEKIMMVNFNDLTPILPQLYQRRGFQMLEQHWIKDLKNVKAKAQVG